MDLIFISFLCQLSFSYFLKVCTAKWFSCFPIHYIKLHFLLYQRRKFLLRTILLIKTLPCELALAIDAMMFHFFPSECRPGLSCSRYVRQRMGRNKLKSFGPLMCRMAMLVHIRSGSFFFKALGITLLFMAGFPDDLVQRETKYRNLDLLQKYYRSVPLHT